MNEIRQISPWYNTEEWNGVYRNIFGATSTLITKQNALDQLLIWKARCPFLPSGIEATMSLLTVYSQDQGRNYETCEDHILRLAYSSALMRFVNHMFDKETAKGLSLFQAAKAFGVPEWIIELRHDTAHSNRLPPLELLREATFISLNWLQQNYWAKHKSCISDYSIGKLQTETETERDITALMNLCVSLSICSHPNCNIKHVLEITDVNLRECVINDAKVLMDDIVNFSNLKTVAIGTLKNAMNNKAKKMLLNDSSLTYVNRALLSDESPFISLELFEHLDHNGYNNDRVLNRNYTQCFDGLLSFLLAHNLLRDFILELIKITQTDSENNDKKSKLAAKWVSVILNALSKNQQFIEKIHKSDIDIKSKDEKEIKRLYYHWYPNDAQRTLLLNFHKPVPKEFRNINFIQPIISNYNVYLVFFIKDLLTLIRPELPVNVQAKIFQLTRVIATPEKFSVLSSNIYTADDLDTDVIIERKQQEDEDLEVDSKENKHEVNKDEVETFGIWKVASKSCSWKTCPIGQLPWSQLILEPMETQ